MSMLPLPKPDDPEVRALIDAALAEGRVTRVPRGAVSHCGYVWCAEKNTLVLRGEGHDWHALNRRSHARRQAIQARRPQIEAKWARVREVAQRRLDGMAPKAIAEAMGLPRSTVYADLNAARQAGIIVERQPMPAPTRDAVLALRRQGLRPAAIAEKLGIGEATVRDKLRSARKAGLL